MSDFSPRRNFGLDLVRAIAILIVLISHARQSLQDPDSGLALTYGGWFGVELFFALSGFLIGTILIRLFGDGVSARSLGRFWVRRWMRTLPAYFFILAFYWIAFGSFQASDLFLLQWPIDGNQGIVPVSWSLAVEEWFYILFPLAVLLCAVLFGKRAMGIAIVAFILAPLLYRSFQYSTGLDPMSIRVNPFRFDGMAYGVAAAYVMSIKGWRDSIERYWHLAAATAFLLLAFDFLRYNGARLGVPLPFQIPSWHHQVTAYTVSGVCAALIVVALYLRSPNVGRIASVVVSYISMVSYSLYLWHLFIFGMIIRYFSDYKGIGLYGVVILTAIIAASLPYVLIETPFMKLRDYLTVRSARPYASSRRRHLFLRS